MALPIYPNTITAAMINKELGRADTASFNINDSAVRTLAGKPSGTISFSDLHGKSNGVTIMANDIRPWNDYFLVLRVLPNGELREDAFNDYLGRWLPAGQTWSTGSVEALVEGVNGWLPNYMGPTTWTVIRLDSTDVHLDNDGGLGPGIVRISLREKANPSNSTSFTYNITT